ncbi:MAG: hypothetical protein MK212_17585 [Saprospiraceae bacterium]|nr:hypothetical protein [Saprospiraceae bacterium]
MQTKKIYAVNYWHPFYSTAVSADVITFYESLEEFYNHIWDKLEEDVTYSE